MSQAALLKAGVANLVIGLITTLLAGHHVMLMGLGGSALVAAALLPAIAIARSPREVDETDEQLERAAVAHGAIHVSRTHPPRAVIVGAGEIGRRLAVHLDRQGMYEIVGFVDDDARDTHVGKWRLLGGRDDTLDLISEHQIDEVIVAYAPTWQQQLLEDLAANHPNVSISLVPGTFEAMLSTRQVECYDDVALVRIVSQERAARETAKRVFDLAVACGALLISAPLLTLIAAIIKLTSPGPIIFRQQRVGRFGSLFNVYKFRTMVVDAEARTGPVLSSGCRDARLTAVGRWLRQVRIDELPQVWNVVRGEMSLVGPRPERPQFVQQFECVTPSYGRRHTVRPGITGLAQVCGGYHTDARDKLRFDLIYIAQQSLWLDVVILYRTIAVVFLPKGR